ncbi:MAG: CBS domain-containing protein [Candidatus Nitrosocaldaceae archaeon]|nr:MAG: CBS domain-containing protein [Candidatus Nitrosocaldaceae archaeon]
MMEREPMTTRLLVKDVMNSPAVTARKDATVQEIANLMKEHKVGSVVITDEEGKAIGMVSDWDIVTKAAARDEQPSKIKVEEIMDKLVSIDSDESITNAAKLFRRHGIKRLAVFYKGELVGVISASDVIAVMPELVDVISEKSRIIRGDIERSTRLVSGYCDECEEWSDYLQYVDGKFVCEDCREGLQVKG